MPFGKRPISETQHLQGPTADAARMLMVASRRTMAAAATPADHLGMRLHRLKEAKHNINAASARIDGEIDELEAAIDAIKDATS